MAIPKQRSSRALYNDLVRAIRSTPKRVACVFEVYDAAMALYETSRRVDTSDIEGCEISERHFLALFEACRRAKEGK